MKRELTALSRAVAGLSSLDLGYPLDENLVRPPPPKAKVDRLLSDYGADLPQLVDLYRLCDGFSLPDVHVGYFLHPLSLVLAAKRRGEPRLVTGPGGGEVLVVGSDGGGGRLALRLDGRGGEVLALGAGSVVRRVFDGVATPPRPLARSLRAFVGRVGEDVDAFVEHRKGWRYLL